MRTIKVIFHVGMSKTATTSIQQTLIENYTSLKGQKVLYPKTYNQRNIMETGTINHNVFLTYIMNPNQSYHKDLRGDSIEDCLTLIKYTIEHIKEEVKASGIETIIFSSEDLYARELELWVELLDGLKAFLPYHLEFYGVCYTLPMLAWLDSAAQQMIKTSSVVNRKLIDHLSNQGSLYKNPISKFAQLMGRENFYVLDFVKSTAGQDDLLKNFFQCIEEITGSSLSDIEKLDLAAHENLCVESVSIINFVNAISPLWVDRKLNTAGGRTLADLEPFAQLKGIKFRLGDDLRAYARERLGEDLKWLKDNYQIDYTNEDEKNGTYISPDDIHLSKEYLMQLIGIVQELSYPMCAMMFGYMCSRMKKPTDGEPSKEEALLIEKLIKRLAEPERKEHGIMAEDSIKLLIKQYEEADNQRLIQLRDKYESQMNRFSLLYRIKNRHPKMAEFFKRLLKI